jgi:hypothetical protein
MIRIVQINFDPIDEGHPLLMSFYAVRGEFGLGGNE